MKKNIKIIISVLLLVFVLVTAVACDGSANLNKLLAKDYNSVTILVQSTHEAGTLTNSFKVSNVDGGSKVEYTCQKFATFNAADGSYQIPANRIETATGIANFDANGNQTSQSGAQVSVELPKTTKVNLDLSEENFQNISNENGKFRAQVVDASALFNQTVDHKYVEIEIDYTKDAITSIVIKYETQSGSPVKVSYTFA